MSEHIVVVTIKISFLLLLSNKFNLILDPFFLNLSDLFVDLFDLLLDAFALVFKWPLVFFTILGTRKVSTLPVESINTKLFLLDFNMSLFNAVLNFLYISLFLFKFTDQLFELFVQELVLTLRIQVIDTYTRDLI